MSRLEYAYSDTGSSTIVIRDTIVVTAQTPVLQLPPALVLHLLPPLLLLQPVASGMRPTHLPANTQVSAELQPHL